MSRRYFETNKERKRYIKTHYCFCSWCPFNARENSHGEHSKYGKKVAKRREYTQGKKRKNKEIVYY